MFFSEVKLKTLLFVGVSQVCLEDQSSPCPGLLSRDEPEPEHKQLPKTNGVNFSKSYWNMNTQEE